MPQTIQNIIEERRCGGCYGCINICPVHAISMKQKEDTHLYPDINLGKCIHCCLCESICPMMNHETWKNDFRDIIAGRCIDENDFMKSSSGGAFKCIVRAWLKKTLGNKQYVCGCIFDQDLKAKHILKEVSTADDIDCFSKSKYIQSNLETVYLDIVKVIREGGEVLFSGTPCQCHALRSIIDFKAAKYQDKVFYVDLICHGAPSQKQFDDHIADLEKTEQCKVLSFTFREKEQLDNGTYYTRSAKIQYENGKVERVSRLGNKFLNDFYLKQMEKMSCLQCPFSDTKRVGDITIGDAWGIEKQLESVNSLKGVSLVLFVSERGLSLKREMTNDMIVYQCDYNALINNNSALLVKGNGK